MSECVACVAVQWQWLWRRQNSSLAVYLNTTRYVYTTRRVAAMMMVCGDDDDDDDDIDWKSLLTLQRQRERERQSSHFGTHGDGTFFVFD